jgi:endonuclease/exonuclease/phosphatase family metal-dependent hydrolase
MKIATWNIERLIKNKNQEIVEKIKLVDADIFVLTETSNTIRLENCNTVSSQTLTAGHDGIHYKTRENRVSIWTKYPIIKTYDTYDPYTSVCIDLETPKGVLTVYGIIIGVFANRQPRFNDDLFGQIVDFKRIFPDKNVCLIGDLNIMFSGFAYPSKAARNAINEVCDEFGLTNTTAHLEKNVDHIILSSGLFKDSRFEIETWNEDLKLSDHRGCRLRII